MEKEWNQRIGMIDVGSGLTNQTKRSEGMDMVKLTQEMKDLIEKQRGEYL